MVVDHCTDGAECATGAEVLGADYTGTGCTQKKPSVCKGKATFRNYAVHTRCTQHATYDPRGPTRRQGLAPKSLHRSLMVTSGAGRHSGPAMRRAARNPPVSPPNPRRSPLALAHPWAPPPPTHGHPAHKMSGSAETLGEQRRDAEGAVECPSRRGDVRDPAVAAGSRVAQWSRAALFAGARLSRQRGAARQRDAPRGGINVGKVVVVLSVGDNSADAHSSLMQCPERETPKRKCQNQSFRFSSH